MDEPIQNPQSVFSNTKSISKNPLYKLAKKIFTFIVGMTVVISGVILFFTPGPALVVIPIGLLILSTEFMWAKKILKWMTNKLEFLKKSVKKK